MKWTNLVEGPSRQIRKGEATRQSFAELTSHEEPYGCRRTVWRESSDRGSATMSANKESARKAVVF